MSNSVLLLRGGTSGESHATSRQSSRPTTNSIPRSTRPSSENSILSAPTTTRNIEPGSARGILREIPGEQAPLPSEKVFPIQIGSEVFRLSGASITSDGTLPLPCHVQARVTENLAAPSYFTRFFQDQLHENGENESIKTLYIDRDPTIFRDIARHLQGERAF
jgi:hypothetical protein